MTGNKEVEDLIEEKAADFYMSMSTGPPKQQGKVYVWYRRKSKSPYADIDLHGKIAVLFYEKRLKKNWFQFSKSEELICWEQWAITITVVEPQTDQGEYSILNLCL